MNLINQCHLKDKVQFLGTVPHHKIGEVLSNQDIFIMPSYFKTFGRVYFEAMALRIPVICAINSGIYGFFKEMKEGISVNHLDIKEIAAKLEMLVSDKSLRECMGRNGYNLVKNYTWKNLAKRYNGIYKDALKMTYEKDLAHI